MEILQGVWKQHPRPRAVVGYGVKFFLPSPPNYVTRARLFESRLTLTPDLKLTKEFISLLPNAVER